MEEEVRIPVILDVQDDGETDKLIDKLRNLRDAVAQTSEAQKRTTSTGKNAGILGGMSDARRIDRSIEAIGRYMKSLQELGSDNSMSEHAQKFTEAINTEIGRINDIIARNKTLRASLGELQRPAPAATDSAFRTEISSAQELEQYLSSLEQKLADVKAMLASDPARNSGMESVSKDIEGTITNIETLTKDLGGLASEWSKVSKEYESAYSILYAMHSKEGIFANGVSDKDLAKANEQYEAAKEWNDLLQEEATATANRTTEGIDQQLVSLDKLVNKYEDLSRVVSSSGKVMYKAANSPLLAGKSKDAASGEAEVAASTRASADAQNAEAKAVKKSAAAFYYKLRAVKMLGFVINQASSAVDAFAKKSIKAVNVAASAFIKLITPIHSVRKAIERLNVSHKKFGNITKSSTKANAGFNLSIKDLIKNLLKYGLGIRSLFVLFNKLRKAITDGLGQLAQGYAEVNNSMSSIVTSMNQIKAAITTVIEPIVHVLAPILEKISALVSDIAYKVASFIAALTGQSMVFKATRNQIDYAESLDKTAKNAKKAKQELSGLDKLNVLHSKDDSGADAGAMGFEKVPIDPIMAEWAKKFKEFLDRLLKPIKAAWAKMKKFVIDSFKYMLNRLLKLGKSVADAFWRVWEEPETQKIFENIFKILGDIFLIIGNIADALRIAWEHNDNGYKIFKAIRDIILIISDGIMRAADYTVEWSKHLSFIPLFDTLANVLNQQVVPAVQKIVDLLVILYEQVLLKIVKDVIEKGLPQLLRIVGKITEAIGIIAEKLRIAIQSGSNGIVIVSRIEDLLQIVADAIEYCADKTIEWAKNLDFRPLLKSIADFLEKIQPMIQFISDTVSKFYTEVLLPFWQYLIEDGGPRLLDLLGKIFGQYDESTGLGVDWEHLTQVMSEFLPTLEQFLELGWEVLLQIIEDLGKAFDDFVNSGALDTIVSKFSEWVEKADPEEIAAKIEKFVIGVAKLWAELQLLSKVIMPVVTGIMTFANVFMQTGLTTTVSNIAKAVGAGGTGGLTGALSGLGSTLSTLAVPILIVVGVLTLMVGAFGGVGNTIAELKERFDQIKESVSQFAEKIGFSDTIESLKESFSNLKGSLEGLRPVFEFLLDILAKVATVIIDTVLGAVDGLAQALTGVVDFVAGVVDVISGLIDIITGLFTGDYAKADSGLETLIKGLGEIFLGVGETITGVINGIAEALAGFIDLVLPGVSEGVGEFVTDVKNFFAGLRHDLIGDPIVYDIRDGIIEGFGEWISQTASDVGGWVTDRVADFTTLASDIGTSIVTMKDDVVNKFSELKDGAGEKAEEFVTIAKEKFDSVKDKAKTSLESSNFVTFGKNAIKGIESGIKSFGTVLSAASKNANDLKSRFSKGLNAQTLVNVGRNLINGLKSGLMSSLSSALSTISNICNQITSRVRSAFQIHSPSRVFADIGELLVKGLEVGVEDNVEDVSKSFDEIVPSDKTMNNFYTKFVSETELFTTNIMDMFDAMAQHIDEVMNNLSVMSALQNFNTQFANISNMRIPDIAKGYKLPSNAEFRQTTSTTEIDLSDLPDIIRNAVVEAITSTADLQTDDGTTIINIDGKEVFQVVKDKNTEYKKRHGKSAFV